LPSIENKVRVPGTMTSWIPSRGNFSSQTTPAVAPVVHRRMLYKMIQKLTHLALAIDRPSVLEDAEGG
jgi:hypothetical protein